MSSDIGDRSTSFAAPGFFPGFLDSDGRPWGESQAQAKNYQQRLEASIKVALLTQHTLCAPIGYFFDNPHLQRVLLKYSGQDSESRAFRVLIKDLVRVSTDDCNADERIDKDFLQRALSRWVSGDGSNRSRLVYLNSVPHEHALELQRSQSPSQFIDRMRFALNASWRVELGRFVDALAALETTTVRSGHFPFDELIRARLLTGIDTFPVCDASALTKLKAVAEATQSHEIRISRSLLRSPELCSDLGVPADERLSAAEYQRIAPVLGHYHQSAFGSSFAIDCVSGLKTPTSDPVTQAATFSLSRRVAERSKVNFPLSRLSFADIFKVRIDRSAFRDQLNQLFDASRSGKIDDLAEAIHAHERFIATAVSRDLSGSKPVDVATGLAESMFTRAGPDSFGILIPALFHLKSMAVEAAANVSKEVQIRSFFWSVRSELRRSTVGGYDDR